MELFYQEKVTVIAALREYKDFQEKLFDECDVAECQQWHNLQVVNCEVLLERLKPHVYSGRKPDDYSH